VSRVTCAAMNTTLEKGRLMSGGQTLYDLVVVGSSAGGIEAFWRLVSSLPTDFLAPLVLAQHLGPARSRPAQPSWRYSCASECTASAFHT
jgi:chemotaxis response regulator CheB